jgi:hypothetical protein
VLTLNAALPALSCGLAATCSALVLEQWLRRRHDFQLVWGAGMLWYAAGAATEAWGAAFGWSAGLYRAWYLAGGLMVAAYLGAGTVCLLSRSRFGYFAAASVLAGGALAAALSGRYPGSAETAADVLGGAILVALTLGIATARHRGLAGRVLLAGLGLATVACTALVLRAPLAGPGYALDSLTGAPVGSAMPGYVRVLSGPLNVGGALCLVGGAAFSAYVYMPKRRLLRRRRLPPVASQVHAALAVAVNLSASLPAALRAARLGRLNSRVPATVLIAAGGFVPSITSGLDRFGITWGFFLGELLGVTLILAGFLVSEEVFRRRREAAGGLLKGNSAWSDPGPQ